MINFLKKLLEIYIFSARADLTINSANEIINKIENTYPEGSEVVMTLAEKFRKEGEEQGILKGIEKGVELGARQSKMEVARKLIKMNMSLEQIADITGLPNKKVEEIAQEMGQ